MKKIFTLLGFFYAGASNAQFNPLVSRNARFNFANTGRIAASDMKAAYVKEEHIYLMLMNDASLPVDSILVSSNFYDTNGMITSSVDYDNEDSTVTRYSYRYNNGKLVEKNYTILFKNVQEAAFKVLYNDNGQEEMIYQFINGLDTPLVYKKEYNKYQLPYRFWATSPNNNNFSLAAEFHYFSDNSLKKVIRYPNEFFPMEKGSESIKVKSSADNKKETVYINDEKKAFYDYNDKGQCTREVYQDIYPKRYLSPSLTPGTISSESSSATATVSTTAAKVLSGPAPAPIAAPVVYTQSNAAYVAILAANSPGTINNTNTLVVSDNSQLAAKQVADNNNRARTADAWNNGTIDTGSNAPLSANYWELRISKLVSTEYNEDGTIKNTTITDYLGNASLFVKNNYTYYR